MIIDKDGEVTSITEEDFKYARKNPYADKKMVYARPIVIDDDILDFFKKLAKEKGVYHGILIADTLRDYIANAQQEGQDL